MRRNKGKIFTKIQDVMGIKSGKYCSSDVSVVSLKGNNSVEASAFMESVQQQSVTYTNCPKRETVTIDFRDILMNNNIIPDCVLGGSVILNDLNGYVVNYGETICPAPNIKDIQRCGSYFERTNSIDFKDYVVTDGKVYELSFNGMTQPGCYTILGDSPFVEPKDTVKSVGEKPDCNSCGPTPQTVIQIQSCENGLTYNVGGDFDINVGDILNLTFKNNTIITNGCYTIVGTTLSTPLDTISTILGKYDICESCMKPTPPSVFEYEVGSYSEINACNAPTGTTFVYSSSSPIEINTFLYTNKELTIPYYSFGLVNYKTKSGSFTLGTGFDGKVSDLNPCV